MPQPHRMRLRPPWEQTRQGDQMLWRRRFGKPSNIEEGEQVFLVIESPQIDAVVLLNGQRLRRIQPAEPAVRFAITRLLQPRNELVLAAASTQSATPEESSALPFGEVRLEIE